MPSGLHAFVQQAVAEVLNQPERLEQALGEWLSEPKPTTWFEISPSSELAPGYGLLLDRRTKMVYDKRRIYINGESLDASGRDARLMHKLADTRELSGKEVAMLSEDARGLLEEWLRAGWLQTRR